MTPNSITCLRSYWYSCLVHFQRYCNNHQQNPPLLRSEGPVSHIHFRKAPKRYSKDYTATIHSVENIISSIKEGEIAIPEIQRPFVWDGSKVRDLMDSLYKGFPVGYIIVWKNPDIRLKNGKVSSGKKILIDGQQRITAIEAAVVGQEVVDSTYKKKRIVIAFNPIEEVFEVWNPAIGKDSKWIPDISVGVSKIADDF